MKKDDKENFRDVIIYCRDIKRNNLYSQISAPFDLLIRSRLSIMCNFINNYKFI